MINSITHFEIFSKEPEQLAEFYRTLLGFGFVFITRKPEFQIPTFRYVVTIAGLFALFCYTQELENLGKCLLGKENP